MRAHTFVLEQYMTLLDQNHPFYQNVESEFKIPFFSKEILKNLFNETSIYLQEIPPLISLSGPTIIVGDIHGNIRDLIRIIKKNGLPNDFTYLFLGDYVDRGEFSTEVLTLLFALQLTFESRVILLRGNHETRVVSSNYGFKDEIPSLYGSEELYKMAQAVFDNMSLAVLHNGESLCLHGGISSKLKKIAQIQELQKPIKIDEDNAISRMVNDILWSDPVDTFTLYQESPRGQGVLFGIYAVKEFLEENHIKRIIRGHSCVQCGLKKQCLGAVLTVFSSGSYHPELHNSPSFIYIIGEEIRAKQLDQLPQVTREGIQYQRAVFCKTLAGLNSGRPIGPHTPNRYWSSRRHSMDFVQSKSSLPPVSILAENETHQSGEREEKGLSYSFTRFAIKRRQSVIRKTKSDVSVICQPKNDRLFDV